MDNDQPQKSPQEEPPGYYADVQIAPLPQQQQQQQQQQAYYEAPHGQQEYQQYGFQPVVGAPLGAPLVEPNGGYRYVPGQPAWPVGFPFDMRPAHNLIDPTNYPKSTQLYQEMCEKFGAHNIIPLPTFLADAPDKARKHWYKCDANAQLYYIYRAPHYKKKIQQMMDLGCCANCCCYDSIRGNVAKYSSQSLCSICFSESIWLLVPQTILCFPGCFSNLSGHSVLFDTADKPVAGGCFNWIQATNFRYRFLKRLRKSGIDVCIAPKCCICLQYSFCTPCVSMQQQVVLEYAYVKRYGFAYGIGNTKARKGLHDKGYDWKPYYTALKLNPLFANHTHITPQWTPVPAVPSLQADIDGIDFPGQETHANTLMAPKQTREAVAVNSRPTYKLFGDWYKTDKAIEAHNERWRGSHTIVGKITME